MASWNVSGCRKREKRVEIDECLHGYDVAVAFLQEANIDSQRSETRNYIWYTGSTRINRKRNLAILCSRWYNVQISGIIAIGPHAVSATLRYTVDLVSRQITVLNVHAPNKGTSTYLGRLGSFITGCGSKRSLIIAGDFNSHLAYEDATESERGLLGKITCHQETNESGVQLRYFLMRHGLSVRSMQMDRSMAWTWTNGLRCSQLDHVLLPKDSKLYVRRIRGIKVSTPRTDHKL